MLRRSFWFFVCAIGSLQAQIPDFRLQGVTATQAVVAYTAPDSRACRLELSESSRYLPIVADVDPQLFANSQLDIERPNTVISPQRNRVVVLGLRAADTARDGKRYSRALQAYTRHYLRVTCGLLVQTTSFETTNIPLGMTYNDPLPADASAPGEYAWPTLDWVDRTQRIIDPKTGLQIRRLSMPTDVTSVNDIQPFANGRSDSGSWDQPSAIRLNDNLSASTTGVDWLFLDANLSFYLGGTHDYPGVSILAFPVQLNAWCEDCSSLSIPNRSLEACLSVDSVSCASKILEVTLESCTSGCTSARYRLDVGVGGPPVLTAWGLNRSDLTDLHRRTGDALRNGNQLFRQGGQRFNIHWSPGSEIVFKGNVYKIASLQNEDVLTLEGDFAEAQESGPFSGSNFGLLLRKKAASQARFYIQQASFSHSTSQAPGWDAGGDAVDFTHCAPKLTPGANSEPGWHCLVGGTFYWIGSESGDVSRIGRPVLIQRPGIDGWGFTGGGFCGSSSGGGPLWDQEDPNVFYCGQSDSSGGTSVIRMTYRGQNTDSGPMDLYTKLPECGPARPSPCWEYTNITPVSRGRNLNQQINALYPDDYALLRGTIINVVGYQSKRLQIMGRVNNASNDALGVLGVFDPKSAEVVAVFPTWKYWPVRWTVLHGVAVIDDPDWMSIPATYFRGSTTNRDGLPGYGPYYSRVTSGSIPGTASTCPPRPANSPIPPYEWPTGDQCLDITVDGEPGDPTPAYYNNGTISSSAGGLVTGTGLEWQPTFGIAQLRAEGKWYRFQYLTATTGRITPEPTTPLRAVPYEIYLEPVNNPKTGNPLHAYLQDAEVRDTFALSAVPDFNLLFHLTEIVRLLNKDGKRWTIQRGYRVVPAGLAPMLPLPANAYLTAVPASCQLGPVYPCASATASWNVTTDPSGTNANGSSIVVDRRSSGLGHGTSGPGAAIASVAETCDVVDGLDFSCYAIRFGEFYADRLLSDTYPVSNNPPFQGRAGIGSPNAVDSHPSFSQNREAAAPEDKVWFTDARPFLGHSSATGSAQDPAVEVEEGLWMFRPDQLFRLRPKQMPTLASCGASPLRDRSGVASRIDNPSNGGAYTYCYSRAGGECREGSEAGQLYVSCPFISRPYCAYPGIGTPGTDIRDICVMDNGAFNNGLVQMRYTEPEADGHASRLLTYGLSQYRYNDLFWNVKTTPDGKWMFFRTQYVNGKRTEAFVAKLPPFAPIDDQSRNGYLTQEISVKAVEVNRQDSVALEFGYNSALECTSRRESCIAAPTGDVEPFYFSTSEKDQWKPIACKDGCKLQFPVIPQRVAYYRLRYYDVDGRQVGESTTNAWAIP